MAAHSQSSQSPLCWVVETLALRRSVFLASSAEFQWRDPGEFHLMNQFLREWCGHWEIFCWFTSGCGCMEGGEGLFLLSSGFNLTLLEYHNTKLWQRKILILDACFTSTVMGRKVGVDVRGCQAGAPQRRCKGGHYDTGQPVRPLCCLKTIANQIELKFMLRGSLLYSRVVCEKGIGYGLPSSRLHAVLLPFLS